MTAEGPCPLVPELAAARLERSFAAIAALLDGVDDDLARWRPAEGRWSLVEIACHLLDEESADFRARLELLVSGAEDDFTPIDPEGWARDRGYFERNLAQVVGELALERERSLAWLRSLGEPDLAFTRTAPWGGEVAAGDILAAWVTHDLLHLRQMLGVLHAHAEAQAAPFRTAYAGAW